MLGERKLPKIVQAKVDKDAGEVTENLSYLGQSIAFTVLISPSSIRLLGAVNDYQ
jgi:hypothetical protein